jgi:Zn-finger protein
MKCEKCGISVFKAPLTRANPVGEIGVWWCYNCIKTHKPDVWEEKIKGLTPVEKDLIKICYNQEGK